MVHSTHTDNYAVMVERARALFCTHDREQMRARLGLATDSAGDILVRFLGREHRVRPDGTVLTPDGAPAGFNAAMTIYDALARDNAPRLSGEFVPTAALHRIHGTHAVHEDLNAPAAARFAGRAGELEAALIARGGRRWGPGDVSYIFDVFDFFPVCLRFYDADEEFPASLQFLWDANALEYLYYETLWYVMGEIVEELERTLALGSPSGGIATSPLPVAEEGGAEFPQPRHWRAAAKPAREWQMRQGGPKAVSEAD